jgi:hypothetical protein
VTALAAERAQLVRVPAVEGVDEAQGSVLGHRGADAPTCGSL